MRKKLDSPREAAKKVLFLVARPLRGGGGNPFVAGPPNKHTFFAASPREIKTSEYNQSGTCNHLSLWSIFDYVIA